MLCDVIFEEERWESTDLKSLSAAAARAVEAYLNLSSEDFEISVLACDDARIATLNAEFRSKPQPTNVLSWPSQDLAAPEDGGDPEPPEADIFGDETELGDIAIAYETCLREADEAGKPFDHHVTHLVIHGILHLLGYDHIRDKDATLMEAIETAILGKMGIPDPYRERDGD